MFISIHFIEYTQINSLDGSFNASSTTLPLTLKTNATTRLTILNTGANAGYIGIGTTSPTANLDIIGNSPTVLKLRSNNSCVEQIYTAGNANYFMAGHILNRARGTIAAPLDMLANDRIGGYGANQYINGAYRGAASIEFFTGSSPSASSYPGYIIFKTVANNNTINTERVRISESGFVGINKTNPAYHLDVVGTVNATAYLLNGAAFTGSSQWTTNGSTINYAGGNVGIGQATPAYKLDVAGTINASSILINGNPFAGGGSQWATIGNTINYAAGNVGIGTTTPDAKLAVNGTIHTKEVKVDLNVPGPDYVFEPTYDLKSLAEIETYIKENKHLPEVPSAKEMEVNGVQLGEMNMLLLKKVEELTLHLIELKKENDLLKVRVEKMEVKK